MTTTDTESSAIHTLVRDTVRADPAGNGVPETGESTAQGPTPDHILQIGTGFWASKTLLSAVELDLFTVLGAGPMTGHEIGTELRLNERSVSDFLDSLVSLGLLARHGDGAQAHYANTADTAAFLDSQSPAYLGGILEMLN
ncbi:MAG TPA: methyltransferase dimerization domain-containing protein, partial [Ilumatobacteraceae bacterium]|nr:methyltransferase dimerization domain-containing protein [Ilumatobacteraceae bacterium]